MSKYFFSHVCFKPVNLTLCKSLCLGRKKENLIEPKCFYLKISRVHVFCLNFSWVYMFCDGNCFKWVPVYYRCTINIATASYQYLSYLFYRKIHLPRFILCYCTSIYVINTILSCYICNHHITFIFSQILNQFFCDIFRKKCLLQTNQYKTYKNLR